MNIKEIPNDISFHKEQDNNKSFLPRALESDFIPAEFGARKFKPREKKLSAKELKKQQVLSEIQFTKTQQFFSLLIVISLIALVYAL